MAHIVVLGLVLTLVAGIASFGVLARRLQQRVSRLPPSLPTPLLLYNLWIAAWLVSMYLGFYLFPALDRAVAGRIEVLLACAVALVSLAWLRAHAVLVDQFLQSGVSARARRIVERSAWVLSALLVTAAALTMVNAAVLRALGAIEFLVGALIFPAALASSVILLTGARRGSEAGIRRALVALSSSYVVLFTLLALLMLVAYPFRLASREALTSADLVLELAYNVLMLAWVARYADAFGVGGPLATAPVPGAMDIAALCESFNISRREREIVELVCQGLTNQEIADRLFISVGTVKDHNYTIFQKVGVRNRTELARRFTGLAAEDPSSAAQPRSTIRRVI